MWRRKRQEKLTRLIYAEEFAPEALKFHEELLGAMDQIDRSAELRDDIYRDLERRLAEPDGEEE